MTAFNTLSESVTEDRRSRALVGNSTYIHSI